MKTKKNETFFDEISSFYDEMIDFEAALKRRKNVLQNFVNEKMETAADLGCGSGLDSISLSKLGLKVNAFDLSQKMISHAKQNAELAGEKISFLKTGLDKIPVKFNNKFDLAVSLGNTLANLNKSQLKKAVKNVSRILKPGGVFVVQILNYKSIISNGERIINITENKREMFVRFYDFYSEYLNFNVIRINKQNLLERELFTTKLYPHTKQDLNNLLKDNSFYSTKFLGGFDMRKFQITSSKDLIITAIKN